MLCLSAAVCFLLWTILSGPGELQSVPVGLHRYLVFAPVGFATAGAACALLWFSGAWRTAAHFSLASCTVYLGFLKVLAWNFIPWVLIFVAGIGFVRARQSSLETSWSLLLLHVMGTIAGLYMAFHLNEFLYGWKPFEEVIRSLWQLAMNLASR